METHQKYALVTGATSGIGYELVKLLAKDRHNLVLVARSVNDLLSVAQEMKHLYHIDVIIVSKDLFSPENAFELYEEVQSKNVFIDILINDAGQGRYGEFTETDIRKELDIINLNISSLVVLTKLFLREMVKNGEGKILNLSSIASKTPGPWQSVYHGTKAFVQSFTEAIRSEVKEKGVTITALLPGATATDFFNKADMLESKVVKEEKLANAAEVALSGYQALMNGDDMVVSGFKNKLQVAMSNVTPDATLADKMKVKQAPANTND